MAVRVQLLTIAVRTRPQPKRPGQLRVVQCCNEQFFFSRVFSLKSLHSAPRLNPLRAPKPVPILIPSTLSQTRVSSCIGVNSVFVLHICSLNSLRSAPRLNSAHESSYPVRGVISFASRHCFVRKIGFGCLSSNLFCNV